MRGFLASVCNVLAGGPAAVTNCSALRAAFGGCALHFPCGPSISGGPAARGGTGGSLHKLGMEQKGAQGHMADLTGKSAERAFSQLCPVLPEGGQRGLGLGAQGQIVKADNAELFRDLHAQFLAPAHDPAGQGVVAAHNGGAAPGKQPGQVSVQADVQMVVAAGEAGVGFQSVFLECAEKILIPLAVNVGIQPPA